MEKIALNATHEIELYANTELEEFEAQLFLKTGDGIYLGFDLEKDKKSSSTFRFKIPDSLGLFLKNPVDYIVYVYIDNARFKADEGKLQVVSKDNFKGAKIIGHEQEDITFKTKIKSSEKKPAPTKTSMPTTTPEPTPTKTLEAKKKKEIKEGITEPIPEPPKKVGKNSVRYFMESNARRKKMAENADNINAKVQSILKEFNEKN